MPHSGMSGMEAAWAKTFDNQGWPAQQVLARQPCTATAADSSLLYISLKGRNPTRSLAADINAEWMDNCANDSLLDSGLLVQHAVPADAESLGIGKDAG